MKPVNPGKNPNRLRRVAVMAVLAGLVLFIVWFAVTDTFDGWLSFGRTSTQKPKAPKVAETTRVSEDTESMIEKYQSQAFPMPVTNGVPESPSPMPAPQDSALAPLLQQLIDGQRDQRALMEILIKAHEKPTSSIPAKKTDDAKARAEARKAYEERIQKAKEWRMPTLEGEASKAPKVGIKRLSTPYSLAPSTLITFTTESRISNETKGPFRAFVSRPVCDSATHSHVVIPQNATLMLEVSGETIAGDTRLPVQVNTLTFPSGNYLTLTNAAVGDRTGLPGFGGEVNHHYLRTFAFAIFSSGLRVGSRTLTMGAGDGLDRAGGAIASDTAAQGVSEMQQFLRTDPTITREGSYEGSLYLREELVLSEPYPGELGVPAGCGADGLGG